MVEPHPKHCKEFGVGGHRVELINPLPKGKVCALMGFAQTASPEIKVQVCKASGEVVAEISKTGTSGEPTPLTSRDPRPHWFTAEADNYFMRVTSAEDQEPRVLLQQADVVHGDKIYAGCYIIAVEDHPEHGDCDFNDCVAYLTWTEDRG
jgi:hypothetical protein